MTLGAARCRGRAGKSDSTAARLPGLSAVMEEGEAEEQQAFSHRQVQNKRGPSRVGRRTPGRGKGPKSLDGLRVYACVTRLQGGAGFAQHGAEVCGSEGFGVEAEARLGSASATYRVRDPGGPVSKEGPVVVAAAAHALTPRLWQAHL